MNRDALYRQFEGLAVATANRVFSQYRKSLLALGYTVEDAVQEGLTVLLELLPKLDNPAYNQAQRTCYVVESVRGPMSNWAKRQIRNGLPDTRERPDPPQPDADGLLDLDAALATLDERTRALVMMRYAGHTYDDIGKSFNISPGQAASRVKAALTTLKRKMRV